MPTCPTCPRKSLQPPKMCPKFGFQARAQLKGVWEEALKRCSHKSSTQQRLPLQFWVHVCRSGRHNTGDGNQHLRLHFGSSCLYLCRSLTSAVFCIFDHIRAQAQIIECAKPSHTRTCAQYTLHLVRLSGWVCVPSALLPSPEGVGDGRNNHCRGGSYTVSNACHDVDVLKFRRLCEGCRCRPIQLSSQHV